MFLTSKRILCTSRKSNNILKDGTEKISLPKILYRHFPIKSMLLGLVARPISRRKFDSSILPKRVSTQVTVTKLTPNINFSDDVNFNCEI